MPHQIEIHGNRLRLLSRFFLAVVPLDFFKVTEQGKYNCVVESYGNVGQVECIKVTVHDFSMLDDRLNMVTDYIPEHREHYRRQGQFNTSKFQLCYLRFLRRKDDVFAKLIAKETTNIGLVLQPQQSLFQ